MFNSVQNDHLFMAHVFDPQSGFVYLEDADDWLSDGEASVSSVVRKVENTHSRKHEVRVDKEVSSCLGIIFVS